MKLLVSLFIIIVWFIFCFSSYKGNTYRYLTSELAVTLEKEAPETLIMPVRSEFIDNVSYFRALSAFIRFHNWRQY